MNITKKILSIVLPMIMAFSVHAEYDYSISGASGWTKTPYNATTGKKIVIGAQGNVKHSWMSGWHGPGGNSRAFCANCRITSRCNVAGLIMRIGNSKPYCVDPVISGAAPASGTIYFAINDMPLNDNAGGFQIKLGGPGVSLGGSTFD